MVFKLSNLNSNLGLTWGYLNPALNNSALYSSSGTVFILTLLPPPPRLNMAGIRTLKFVSASFEKRNPKGSFFVGTFEKVVRSVQILSAFLKKKIRNPLFKNQPSLVR